MSGLDLRVGQQRIEIGLRRSHLIACLIVASALVASCGKSVSDKDVRIPAGLEGSNLPGTVRTGVVAGGLAGSNSSSGSYRMTDVSSLSTSGEARSSSYILRGGVIAR